MKKLKRIKNRRELINELQNHITELHKFNDNRDADNFATNDFCLGFEDALLDISIKLDEINDQIF